VGEVFLVKSAMRWEFCRYELVSCCPLMTTSRKNSNRT